MNDAAELAKFDQAEAFVNEFETAIGQSLGDALGVGFAKAAQNDPALVTAFNALRDDVFDVLTKHHADPSLVVCLMRQIEKDAVEFFAVSEMEKGKTAADVVESAYMVKLD